MAYIGQTPAIGNYQKLDALLLDGNTTIFDLKADGETVIVASSLQTLVTKNGLVLDPENDYTTSGSQIIFTTAPEDTDIVTIRVFGSVFNFPTVAQGGIDQSNKLADNIITNAKMADSSVGTAELIDANVTLAKLAPNSVNASKIVDGSITTSKTSDGAITSSKLANNSVTTAKVTDANITLAKLASDVTSYISSTANSASKLVLISSQSVSSASPVSAVNFTGFIDDAEYSEYVLKYRLRPSSSNSVNLRISNDSGSTYITTANYTDTALRSFSGSTAISILSGSSRTASIITNFAPTATGYFVEGELRFRKPSDSASKPLFKHSTFHFNYSNLSEIINIDGTLAYNVITSFNAFQILAAAGNIAEGDFYLYGIKK